jgi:hypothetical protein
MNPPSERRSRESPKLCCLIRFQQTQTAAGKTKTQAEEGPMTVLIYVNTSKPVGDPDHLKVFANQDAAETWLQENDPEGVAFEYEVLE